MDGSRPELSYLGIVPRRPCPLEHVSLLGVEDGKEGDE